MAVATNISEKNEMAEDEELSSVETVLDKVIRIFKSCYGNLRKEEDWLKLLDRLIEKSSLRKGKNIKDVSKQFLKEVLGNELVNGTILLFQSMCTVRFAFMDGQARMAAVHYYIRKIVPTIDGKALGLSLVYGDKLSVLRHWSLEKSAGKGKEAVCALCMPEYENRGCQVTVEEIWERRELSRVCYDRLVETRDHLIEMEPASFSDVLLRVLGAMATNEEKYNGGPPYVLGQILKKVKSVIKFIFMWLVENDSATFVALKGKTEPGEETLKYGEELHRKMFKQEDAKNWKEVFPSLNDTTKVGRPNLHALILCLAAATTEKKSAMYLEDCIKKDWKVQIGEGRPPAGGAEGEDLHCGTFIAHGNKKAWFESKLYAVS